MQLKNKVLFDSSAVLALIKKEPGYEVLEDLLGSACISTVNLSEVVSVLSRTGIPKAEIEEIVGGLVPEIIPFSYEASIIAGSLIVESKELGLSLGDRACIATGIVCGLPVYTTDRVWQKLQLQDLKIVVAR
jgi:hypothetical protein